MPPKIPYMLAPGRIPKILEKIQEARRPDRFTQDFLETKLGQKGGSARPAIPLLKRMGFLASDGTPTPLYDQFRNAETQGAAVAQGMKNAFSDLYERNEYANDLSRDQLTSLVTEITGAAKNERTTNAVVGTFATLNEMADFDAALRDQSDSAEPDKPSPGVIKVQPSEEAPSSRSTAENVDFKVSYTITLNLPETTDPDVFNAIFRALKENLLRD